MSEYFGIKFVAPNVPTEMLAMLVTNSLRLDHQRRVSILRPGSVHPYSRWEEMPYTRNGKLVCRFVNIP